MNSYMSCILSKIKPIFILIIFLSSCSKPINFNTIASIKKIQSFKQIHFDNIIFQQPTIVFLDVDDVLITSEDLVLKHSPNNPFKIVKELRKDIFSNSYNKKALALNIWGELLSKRKVTRCV